MQPASYSNTSSHLTNPNLPVIQTSPLTNIQNQFSKTQYIHPKYSTSNLFQISKNSPQITQIQNISILHQDTLINNAKQNNSTKYINKSIITSTPNLQILQKSNKQIQSQQQLAHYLLNQILLVINNMNKFNRNKINFLDYLELLRQLNMIPNSYQPSQNDWVFRFWNLLIHYSKDYICLINLSMFILAVMNVKANPAALLRFFQQIPYIPQGKQSFYNKRKQSQKAIKKFKKNKEGFFELSRQDVNFIYQSFSQFRITRIYLGQIQKKVQISKSIPKQQIQSDLLIKSLQLDKSKKQISSSTKLDSIQKSCIKKINQNKSPIQNNSHRLHTIDAKIIRSSMISNNKKSRSKQKKNINKQEIQFQKKKKTCMLNSKIYLNRKINITRQQELVGEINQIQKLYKGQLKNEIKKGIQKKCVRLNQRKQEKAKQQSVNKLYKKLERKGLKITMQNKNDKKQIKKKLIVNIQMHLNRKQIECINFYEGDKIQEVARNFIVRNKLQPRIQSQLIRQIQKAVEDSLYRNQESARQQFK